MKIIPKSGFCMKPGMIAVLYNTFMETTFTQWQELFALADEILDTEPWNDIGPTDLTGLQYGKRKDTVWINTLGAFTGTKGLALYEGEENLKGYFLLCDAEKYHLDEEFCMFQQNMLALYYGDDVSSIPLNELEAMRDIGLPTEGENIPYFVSLKEGTYPCSPDSEEAERLIRYLKDYLDLVKLYRRRERTIDSEMDCFILKQTAQGRRSGFSPVPDNTYDPGYLIIDDEDMIENMKEAGRASCILSCDILYLNIPIGRDRDEIPLEHPFNPLVAVVTDAGSGEVIYSSVVKTVAQAQKTLANALAGIILRDGAPEEVRVCSFIAAGAVENLCHVMDIEMEVYDELEEVDTFARGFRNFADAQTNPKFS